jgi:hypothetical protein
MQSDKIKSLMPRKCSTENTWHHLNEMQRKTGLSKYSLVVRAVELMWQTCFDEDARKDESDALMRAVLRDTLAEKMAILGKLKGSLPVGSPVAKQETIDR